MCFTQLGAAEVDAHGRLEDAEAEGGHHGKHVLEDLALQVLVGDPLGAVGEEVELQGKALRGGLQLAHHDGHAAVDAGVMLEVVLEIVAEDVEVDHEFVFPLDAFEPAATLKLGHLLVGAERDGAHVDVYGTLDTAAAALLHAAPVLERVAHESIGRYGGDGLVPVAHLDGGEGHLLHIAVGPVLGHGDPVAGAQHVVGRELYACHETHDGVFEHEHEHGGRGSQGGEYVAGILVDEDADHDDEGHADDHDLEHLVDALDGVVLEAVLMAGEVVQGREERAQQLGYDGYEVDEVDLEQEVERGVTVREGQGHEHGDEDGWHQAADILEQGVAEQDIVPSGTGGADEPLHQGEQEPTAHDIGHEYDEGYGGYGYEPVEPRTAIGRDAQRGEPAEKGGIHFEL